MVSRTEKWLIKGMPYENESITQLFLIVIGACRAVQNCAGRRTAMLLYSSSLLQSLKRMSYQKNIDQMLSLEFFVCLIRV